MANNHPVVVGVDGSEPATQAVRWAAGEAARRRRTLRLVHAGRATLPRPLPAEDLAALREQVDRWLTEARAAAVAVEPDLPLETSSVDAAPVDGLLRAASSAALLVVGNRGRGGFTGLLLGSTSVALAGRAPCPVVVVRGEETPGGSVVVGVDGTPMGEAAVEFAFEEAATRGADLVAVHCWADPAVSAGVATGVFSIDYDLYEREAGQVLAGRLAGWQEKYPDVRVTRAVVRDHPTQALLHFALTARLVVVGSRGRGGFAGLVLGSTSQYLLQHAPCPVAVVRVDHQSD